MGGATERIRTLWSSLEPRGQLTIAAIAVFVVGAFYFLFQYGSSASYSTLVSAQNPSQVGQMTKALDSAGIQYRLANGGTEIDVRSSQLSQANVALASKGLTPGNQPGMEIFDKTSLAMTDFQQKVDYQRALEGEIDRAITQINGITGADVQLVIPDDTLFTATSPHATAAVLLTTVGSLDPSTVSGIAHLVASSVKGLDTGNVTITDGTGALLWPTPGGSGGAVTATSKLAAQQLYSAQLGAQITSMLDSTLGPNKALARVQADINVDQTSFDKTTYAKKGTPLQKQTSTETLTSTGGGTVAPAGAGIANTGTAAGAGSKSNYKNSSGTTSFGVDKTVQRTVVAPGSVNQLNVALLVDSSVPKAELTSIKQSVASLAGINTKRGDTLTVSTIKFAAPPAAPAAAAGTAKGGLSSIMANPLGLARYVLLGLGCLLFLFFMSRHLKRREKEGLGAEPTWLREITRAMPVAELEASRTRELTNPQAQKSAALRAEASEIAMRQPDQLAQQVGAWLKE
jgi:flagellar M-ring protein FliF